MKDVYSYKDLEDVAKTVFDLMWEHAETFEWESGWNKSRVLTEAVQRTAFGKSTTAK